MKPTISIIVAVARDNAIGRNGELVVRLRADMRHFREVTMGHPVIMGRKTWESLPSGALPGRRNIVISRNPNYVAQGAEVFDSLESAFCALSPDDSAMIIGGEQIYRQALPYAQTIHLTEIDTDAPDADTFFPELSSDEWDKTDMGQWITDPETGLKYRFGCLYRR